MAQSQIRDLYGGSFILPGFIPPVKYQNSKWFFWHSESTLWILERKGSRAHVAGMTSSFFSRFSICLAFRVGAVFCLQQLNKLLAVYAQGACLWVLFALLDCAAGGFGA